MPLVAGSLWESHLPELTLIGDDAIAHEDEATLRAAFSDLPIVREPIIADGNFLAARNTFSGDFTGVFTYSPIGPVEPTGQQWTGK